MLENCIFKTSQLILGFTVFRNYVSNIVFTFAC